MGSGRSGFQTRSKGYVNQTFRLDNHLVEGLDRIARQQNLSVNVLAGKAIRKFVEWDSIAERFGYASYPHSFMSKLLSYLSDDEVRDLARWNEANVAREFNQFWIGKRDLASIFQSLNILSTFANRFDAEESDLNDRRIIIIRHNLGGKWSLFFEEAVRFWLTDSMREKVGGYEFSRTDSQVMITIYKPVDKGNEKIIQEPFSLRKD